MSKNNKAKMHGVSMMGMEAPESTMSLEGQHATTMKAHQIGKKVQMTVTGTKQSHRMNSDGSHSASFKIHSVKVNDADKTGGPNSKGSKNDEDDTEASV